MRTRIKPTSHNFRLTILIALLSVLLITVPYIAANDETPTPAPAEATTETTVVETTTTEPTVETLISTPVEETPAATSVPATAVVVPTIQPTAGGISQQSMQTSCRLHIDDLSDNNPFTYSFSATNANNMAAFSWNFGDTGTANTATANHTYATTGSFTITLTCTPNAGFGAPITLTGGISVSSTPVAAFNLTPSTMLTGLPPFNVATVNHSTGGGLTYAWKVSTSSNPADAGLATATTENTSYSFASYGVFWFHLTVTDGAGVSAGASQSVTLSAPPPQAQFTMTPADGTSPLNVTVQGVDLGMGPITSWSWNFGDGSPVVTGQGPHNHTFTLSNPLVAQSFFVVLSYSGPGGSGTFTREVGVYPPAEPVLANFTSQAMGNAGGGVQYCFTNLSIGPVTTSRWDFDNDGTYDEVNNNAVVCHVYMTENTFTVRLFVENIDASATSSASDVISVFFSPVANFTVTPGFTVTWGTTVNFDSSSSTGTILTYSWDFNGDGTEDSAVANPGGILLTTLGNNTIRLTVSGPGGTSYVEKIIFIARASITCDFTGSLNVLPTAGAQAYNSNIGGLLTRTVTSYEWTITGSGVGLPMTFNTANINVDWTSIGTGDFAVTLHAVASDGADCTETKTVTRAWLPLNCQISDNLPATLYANGVNYTFTANVSNLDGRSVVGYIWYVDGVNQGVNTSTFTRSWSTNPGAPVNETIRYEVVVDNGDLTTSGCFEEEVVTLNPFPVLTCTMPTNLPGTVYPNGNTYNFSTNIGGLSGRPIQSYTWYLDGVLQSSTINNYDWTNIIDTSLTPRTFTVRYEVVVSNGGASTSDCFAERTFTVVNFPPLTCNNIGSQLNPIPALPDNMSRSYTYTANMSGIAGRPAVYVWTMGSGNLISQLNNTAVISWDAADSSAAPGTPDNFSVAVTVTNPDGTTTNTNCGMALAVQVQVPRLTCAAPIGDLTPVNGENNTYTTSISNQYGRTLGAVNWTLEVSDGVGGWLPVTTQTAPTFVYSLFTPGTQYRLSYATTVTAPYDDCVSAYQTLNVTGSGVNFQCDAFPNGNGNIFNPTSAATNYIYSVDMDNGNLISLHYTFVLVGPGITERILGTSTSANDGIVAGAALSGASMGPVGNYNLRVDVRAVNNTDNTLPTYSNYTCSMMRALVVGTLTVNYGYTAFGGGALNNSAVGVGQQICFTNTSDTSHLPAEISRLTYVWNIGGTAANNNFNSNTVSAEQLPACMSFSQPGSYTVNLVGTNDYQGDAGFMRIGSHSVTFTVYGLQSIAINRSAQVFAPATMSFGAVGTNISGGYTWNFYRIGNGTPIATLTGQNVNQFFGTPGDYRAVVTGTGPLGATSAQVDFTLLSSSQIRAAFTPSQYGGVAPMHVCFTDQSVGSPITSRTWDFGNGQTLTYLTGATPSEICADYTTPSTSYVVRLTITNGTATETATNTVRTYTLLESSATFSITPNGAAQYCFTANVTGSTAVTGWEFGDTNTGGAQNTICHTYASSGTYIVYMNIVNTTTGEPGQVVRTVTVDLTGGAVASLTVVGSCTPQRTATFRITNGGGAMTTSDQVVIRDLNNNIILMESFTLAAGAYRDFIVTDQSGTVSLHTTDSNLNATTDCEYPPAVTVVAICNHSLPVFTVSNSDGPMITPQVYEIRNSNGDVVDTGSFQLARGAAPVTFAVPAGSNPYDTYTFVSTGDAGTFNVAHRCGALPVLTVQRVCLTGTQFIVTNNGSSMLTPQNFTVVDTLTNINVTPVVNSFQLNPGEAHMVSVSGDPMANYTFATTGFTGALAVSGACDHLNDAASLQSTDSVAQASTAVPTGGAGIDGVSFPDWAGVPTCGYNCPPFRLYHTDETGDWEIFRLDGADAATQESFRRNLSLGEGEGINDMSPSLSPNYEYIVFTSNRATEPGQPENWEIFVASTSGDEDSVQRVTFNSIANDTDPVWGPNNFVVYETTRHGNWDLYMIDMSTGIEYQLTDSVGDDINPFWSPDGSKLVFQSNRDGNGWQIYELDLLSRSIKPLSDGTTVDVDPQYANDGTRVVYRTYTDSDQSVIAIMNADGSNPHTITTANENATNAVWSPSNRFIAYQSDLDGDLDIYVHEVASGVTRKLTDNTIADYAPTWLCNDERVMFTSDIMAEPDIFEADVLPLDAPAIHVDADADQMTFEDWNDIYPSNSPSEENASREGRTVLGSFGEQTSFLHPEVDVTLVDVSIDDADREEWREVTICPLGG